MKKSILIAFTYILFPVFLTIVALGGGRASWAQSCGFNAANDYICGATNNYPGPSDVTEIPESFQPVIHPDGGFVRRPVGAYDYNPHNYNPGSSPPNPDCYECSGGGYGEFLEHLKDREGFPTTCDARYESEGCGSQQSSGCQPFVYKDSRGFDTVGVGHLVRPEDGLSHCQTISTAQADAWLDEDAQYAWDMAESHMEEAGIPPNPCFQLAMGSVNFQLGSAWIDEHTRTWNLIRSGDYCGAADEVENSAWAEQTPVRVADFQNALRELGGCGGANDDSGGSCGGGNLACGGWDVSESERALQISETDDAYASYCARGVANIMLELGYPVTRGNAHDWDTTLPANGWVCDPSLTPETAPPGAILQFDSDTHLGKPNRGTGGGSYGHVEIVTVDSSGRRQYVSDRARSNWGGSVPDNFQCAWVHPSMSDDSCEEEEGGLPADPSAPAGPS